MYVHHSEDNGIDLVHDEDLWISRYKGVETHVKVQWGGLVADLLGDGGWCIGIRVHLQAVVMELVFNAEKFCFGDRMVCSRDREGRLRFQPRDVGPVYWRTHSRTPSQTFPRCSW